MMAGQYTEISLSEMDAFMRFLGFRRAGVDETKHEPLWGNEHQYDFAHEPSGMTVRMFSTIDTRDGHGRKKGGDAIRFLILRRDGSLLRGAKFTRVHRVKNWRKNLVQRFEDIHDALGAKKIRDEPNEPCSVCNAGELRPVLNKRHETFMACSNRACRNSRSHTR